MLGNLAQSSRWLLQRAAVPALLAVTVASCSGSSDPMAPFTGQSLTWTACDAAWVGEANAALLAEAGDRARCALMRAPLDYAAPWKGELKVAMLRLAAQAPQQRQGALFINPGGPGADGLPFPLLIGNYWSKDGTTDAAVVPLYQQLAHAYDLIGFSPRGTGQSTTLTCTPARALRFVADPTRDLDAENLANALYDDESVADGCAAQDLTPYVNTDATARDLDLARQLLGEEKLNYIGLSYGTWLGNWYASLFPERVGRMLLSGVTDFGAPLGQQILTQEAGMQRVLDDVLIPYAVAYPDRLGHLADDGDAVHSMLAGFDDALHWATVQTLSQSGLISQSTQADAAALVLLAAKLVQAQLQQDPALDEHALQDRMAAYDFVGDASRNAVARTVASALVGHLFSQADHVQEPGEEGMFWAVVCNDTGAAFTPEDWLAEGNASAAAYADFGGLKREDPCLYWRYPPTARPPQHGAARAGGIVMLQGELDPLTVLAGARRSLDLLPNASFIEIEDEYTHAPLVPYGNRCVDEPIARYLLDGTQPAKDTTCPRRPLPAETGT